MIKIKGDIVEISGKDEQILWDLAHKLGKTRQEAFDIVLKEYAKQLKTNKKTNKRSK